MIIDKIENISKYEQIPNYVVNFVNSLNLNTKIGKYELNNNEFVNIEEYETKNISKAKFEAHKKYIDIQILLTGSERIYIKSVNNLKYPMTYDNNKDIMFFEDSIENSDYVTLDGTNFALIYPHEAHAPQVSTNNDNYSVKKVVVKLLV